MFIVIGAGRGGTSVLAGLLDAHGMLEVGFEQFAKDCLLGKNIITQDITLLHERAAAFRAACDNESRLFPDKIYGNKITTEQLYGLEDHNLINPSAQLDVLDIFFNVHLKNTKIVFVLRDGRACVRSKISGPVNLSRWPVNVGNTQLKFLNFYNPATTIIYAFVSKTFWPTQETLSNVCRFMEVPYQDSMLSGTNSIKMAPDYRGKLLDISKSDLSEIPVGCIERIYDELEFCGYL